MFAVIFEVQPRPECREAYLELAGRLRPALEAIDGFIANERFASAARPGWLLSLSVWRDEKAVVRWRTLPEHHAAQRQGRFGYFQDYHLRVGEIAADSDLPPGEALPQQRLDATETGAARLLGVTISDAPFAPPPAEAPGLLQAESFESITTPGRLLLLTGWRDAVSAAIWPPAARGQRHRLVRVVRDYGFSDRREAPQYFPPAG